MTERKLNNERLEEMIGRRMADAKGDIEYSVNQALSDYGISKTLYRMYMKRALEEEKIIDKKEYSMIISDYFTKDRKLLETIQSMWDDWEFMTRKQVCEKYKVGKNPLDRKHFSVRLWMGIEAGLFTEKQYNDRVTRKCEIGWERGCGSSHEILSAAGKEGGKKTQEVAPYVQGNLNTETKYGDYPKLMYDGEVFASKGELRLYLFLKTLGKIRKPIKGENFQVNCGEGRHTIDFVVKNNGEKIACEYHPFAKGISDPNYRENRTKFFNEHGYPKALIIERRKNWYPELKEIGYVSNHKEYIKFQKKVDEKIEKKIELLKIPF